MTDDLVWLPATLLFIRGAVAGCIAGRANR